MRSVRDVDTNTVWPESYEGVFVIGLGRVCHGQSNGHSGMQKQHKGDSARIMVSLNRPKWVGNSRRDCFFFFP